MIKRSLLAVFAIFCVAVLIRAAAAKDYNLPEFHSTILVMRILHHYVREARKAADHSQSSIRMTNSTCVQLFVISILTVSPRHQYHQPLIDSKRFISMLLPGSSN